MNLSYENLEIMSRLFVDILDAYDLQPYHWVSLYYDSEDRAYGYQENSRIWVNFAQCKTWEDAIGTMLHEVCHLMQDQRRVDEAQYEAEAKEFAETELERWLKCKDSLQLSN